MKQELIDVERCAARSDFCHARSDVLDAFADLESYVSAMLRLAGKSVSKGQCLGQRMQVLRGLEASSQLAKSNFAMRDRIVDEISDLLPVRADIVHSRMGECSIDGQKAAVFMNSHDSAEPFPMPRFMTIADLKRLAAIIQKQTEKLKTLNRNPNQPSSPPPPLPGAATGP
jgi:hypothetical protein